MKSCKVTPDRLLANLKAGLSHPTEFFRSVLFQKQATDLERWSKPDSLDPDWDSRTRLMAGYIPDGSRVIEFGAARLVLPRYLGPNCTYHPSDVVQRSHDTVVIDLNADLPTMSASYDYAVLSGVVEYIRDPERLLRWLGGFCRHCVVSYATTDGLSDPITRARNGWINHLSEKELMRLSANAGWQRTARAQWRKQIVLTCAGPLAREPQC